LGMAWGSANPPLVAVRELKLPGLSGGRPSGLWLNNGTEG
jgi:hypothetical protein